MQLKFAEERSEALDINSRERERRKRSREREREIEREIKRGR